MDLDFSQYKVLVIGDCMLDSYVHGQVHRQSPEADIPILNYDNQENKLGGALNVAINFESLGAQTSIISLLGNDDAKKIIEDLSIKQNIKTTFIVDSSRKSTVKTRFYASGSQLLRVDNETTTSISDEIEHQIIEKFEKEVEENQYDAIVLQDYGKGIFTQSLFNKIIEKSLNIGISIFIDPKRDHLETFDNCIIKPNLKELEALSHSTIKVSEDELYKACKLVQQKSNCLDIWVTLSSFGIYHFNANKIYPCESIEVVDVCGAGDSVFAILVLSTLDQMPSDQIAKLCNFTGKYVCNNTGVVPISISYLKKYCPQSLS